MQPITLYQIDPARNRQRFYHLDIQKDLFGHQSLVRVWGRIGKRGHMRTDPYETDAEVELAASKLMAAKHRKGYVISQSEKI